jgi:hypothetical protein
LEKLSADYTKASEALRAWGLVEGDDLGVSSLPAVDELLFNNFLAIGHTYCFINAFKPIFFGSVAVCITQQFNATPT